MTAGVCLNDEEKGQIDGSNVVWNAGDDASAGSTAYPAYSFPGTLPTAIVHSVSVFIWSLENVG